MMEMKPLSRCDAVVTIPGSKSFTHRALIASALADGESVLLNALRSEDTQHTAGALEKFGVPIFVGGDAIRVQGTGGNLKGAGEKVYVGDSGTSMRFLTALAALKNGRTQLDGSERMRQRPIGSLLDGLNALGIKATSENGNGCPPIVIDTVDVAFEGGEVTIDASLSSQFVSALLRPAPLWRKGLRLKVIGETARPFIDMTLRLMEVWGARSSIAGAVMSLPRAQGGSSARHGRASAR
jgi:3-phosphoshikimate 1-carboxyvinyltransferase